MPCSAISKDRNGLMYAHSQASKVFYTYAQKCIEQKLVIRMIECVMSAAKYPIDIPTKEGLRVTYIECSRAVCEFQITDSETHQSEEFMGAGLGDNEIWSDTSALTVAFKEALLLYFMTAWPQPTNMVKVIKDELKTLKGIELGKAIKNILPKKFVEILTQSEELTEFFGREIKTKK